ncbi:MAG TPA: DUF5777 family beta-barrel protein [bacterium]
MRTRVFLIMLLYNSTALFAFENSMPNLTVPSELQTGQMRLTIQHRFYGRVNDRPGETFFGVFDAGANTMLGLRAALGRRFEANAFYVSMIKEYQLGMGFGFSLGTQFSGLVEARYFSFRTSFDRRESSVFLLGTLQSRAVAKRCRPVVNVGYDGYWDRFGLGLGLGINVLERLSLLGEFFPQVDPEPNYRDAKSGFTAGFRIRTYGHFFLFLIGNSFDIGSRQMMRGAENNDLHLGFSIQRLID